MDRKALHGGYGVARPGQAGPGSDQEGREVIQMYLNIKLNPNGASNAQIRLEQNMGSDGMINVQGGAEAMVFRTWPEMGR
jgi:hypothetical protein